MRARELSLFSVKRWWWREILLLSESREESPFLEMHKAQLGKALYKLTAVDPALSMCLDQMTPRGTFHPKLFYNIVQIDINCCLAAKVNSYIQSSGCSETTPK